MLTRFLSRPKSTSTLAQDLAAFNPEQQTADELMDILGDSTQLNQLDEKGLTLLTEKLSKLDQYDRQVNRIKDWLLSFALTQKTNTDADPTTRLLALLHLLEITEFYDEFSALLTQEQTLAVNLLFLMTLSPYDLFNIYELGDKNKQTACLRLETLIRGALMPDTFSAIETTLSQTATPTTAFGTLTTPPITLFKGALFTNLAELYRSETPKEQLTQLNNEERLKLLRLGSTLMAPTETELDVLVTISQTFIAGWELQLDPKQLKKLENNPRESVQIRGKKNLESESARDAGNHLLAIMSIPKVLDAIIQQPDVGHFQAKVNQILDTYPDLFFRQFVYTIWNPEIWETGQPETRTVTKATLEWLFQKVNALREQRYLTDQNGNLNPTGLSILKDIARAKDPEFIEVLFNSTQYRMSVDIDDQGTPPLYAAIIQLDDYDNYQYLLAEALAQGHLDILAYYSEASNAFKNRNEVKTAANLDNLFHGDAPITTKVHDADTFVRLLTGRYSQAMANLASLTPPEDQDQQHQDAQRSSVHKMIKKLPVDKRRQLYALIPNFEAFPLVNRIITNQKDMGKGTSGKKGMLKQAFKQGDAPQGKALKTPVLLSIHQKLFGHGAIEGDKFILWKVYCEQHKLTPEKQNEISAEQTQLLRDWLLTKVLDSSSTVAKLGGKSGGKTAQVFADFTDARFNQLFEITGITNEEVWKIAYPRKKYLGSLEQSAAAQDDDSENGRDSLSTIGTEDLKDDSSYAKPSQGGKFSFRKMSFTSGSTKQPGHGNN